jgi:hypothetical protein
MRGRKKEEQQPDAAVDPIDTAWRTHQAQADWTGKVDAKASFAFAIESAAIATVVALTAKDRLYSDLDTWWLLAMYAAGLAFLLGAAALAVMVVIPRLRGSKTFVESKDNFIYFGHARHWSPAALEDALRKRDILPMLSNQIVQMAKIAWVKHLRVRWSFRLASAGGVLLVGCGIMRTLM